MDPIERLPERITGPRLTLRRWHHDEARLLSAAIVDSIDHLRPWMPWVKFEPLTVAERVTLIEGWTREWEGGGDCYFGVFLDGDVVGGSGLHRRVGPNAIEIGYWIHPAHVRRGYATELTAAMTTAAFDVPTIERVEVHTDEANEASAGVPAKLGFHRERVDLREPQAPGETGRLVIWTTTKEAWEHRATSGPEA
jgi:RimJ/RimL family protein N-acetyltransferase